MAASGDGAQGPVRTHRDLVAWQKAMDLTVEVFRLRGDLPRDEQFRLIAQWTRAAASVPANIAEGRGRATAKDFAQFLSIARGSLFETDTFLALAVRLGYLSAPLVEPCRALIVEISKMLVALRTKLLANAAATSA